MKEKEEMARLAQKELDQARVIRPCFVPVLDLNLNLVSERSENIYICMYVCVCVCMYIYHQEEQKDKNKDLDKNKTCPTSATLLKVIANPHHPSVFTITVSHFSFPFVVFLLFFPLLPQQTFSQN